ncbi:MAG TPA: hypothetical protein PKA88_30660 [Polyangiaceae bacterium]|nr:hypothetical protein [Polyangiaceae bacterium]
MTHNIFAHTEPTPAEGYPAYVSINRDDQGRHTITVRSRGNGGRDVATIEVSELVLARIAVALLDPRKRLGYGGATGVTLRKRLGDVSNG